MGKYLVEIKSMHTTPEARRQVRDRGDEERSARSVHPGGGWVMGPAQAPAVTPSTMALKVLLGRMAFDAFAGSGWK